MTAIPDRRPHFVEVVQWAGASWLIGVGLNPDGRAVEIWVDPADTEVEIVAAVVHLAHGYAISVSHLLRSGVRAADHAARLDCQHPDLITLALRIAVKIENSRGALVRQVEGWRAARLAGTAIDLPAELAEVRERLDREDAEFAASAQAEIGRGGPSPLMMISGGPPARVLP